MFQEAWGASRKVTPRCSKAAKGEQKPTLGETSSGIQQEGRMERIEYEKVKLQGTVATPIVKPVSDMSNTFSMNDSFKGKEEKHGGGS